MFPKTVKVIEDYLKSTSENLDGVDLELLTELCQLRQIK